MNAPIPDYRTYFFLDRLRRREQALYEVNEWDEPDWYDMPESVTRAYEDAMLAERY